ncbi:MAG TPA: hypothetical protein HPQ00_16930, partial [Magnetococcales bacterium]|nr:hypothetical protein [Magnetococcales bacterium]
MGYWNLLVVLCFFVLYLGIAVVFRQLRGLRDDMSRLGKEMAAREIPEVDDRAIKALHVRLQQLGTELLDTMEKIPKTMQHDLEAIQGEIRMINRSMVPMMGMGMGSSARGGDNEESFKANAYREARLLLANNVDEDRDI